MPSLLKPRKTAAAKILMTICGWFLPESSRKRIQEKRIPNITKESFSIHSCYPDDNSSIFSSHSTSLGPASTINSNKAAAESDFHDIILDDWSYCGSDYSTTETSLFATTEKTENDNEDSLFVFYQNGQKHTLIII